MICYVHSGYGSVAHTMPLLNFVIEKKGRNHNPFFSMEKNTDYLDGLSKSKDRDGVLYNKFFSSDSLVTHYALHITHYPLRITQNWLPLTLQP